MPDETSQANSGSTRDSASVPDMSAALHSISSANDAADIVPAQNVSIESNQSRRGGLYPPTPANDTNEGVSERAQAEELVHSLQDAVESTHPLAGAPVAIQKAEPAGGIEILVKLAESGEIDPKNVDIIDVTDKFLKAIAAAPKENLRQSGRVLFHACVLLRMKAEALLAAANADFDAGDDFLDFGEGGEIIYDSNQQAVGRQITLHDLERALVRRAHTRQNRHRRVTLDQLIEALREAERIEKSRSEKQPRAPRIELAGQHEVNDVDDILDLAHDEDIETTITCVERILEEYLTSGDKMQLVNIIRLLDRHGDWVDAFLAVLFLSNAGKITLEQETFWGPLYIVRCDTETQQAGLAGSA